MEGLNLKKIIPWKKILLLLVGIGLIVFLVRHYGAGSIGGSLLGFGGSYITILILSFFWYFLQTLAWNMALNRSEVSFWSLFKTKLGGEGLNMVSPFALVGGDPVRVDLLKKQQVEAAGGSIVADRGVQWLSLGIVIVVGLTVGVWNLTNLHTALRWTIPTLTLLALVYLLWNWRKGDDGLFSSLLRSVQRCKTCQKASPAVRGTLNEHDRLLTQFYRERRGPFWQALLLHLLAQALRVAEIYLIGTILLPTFPLALALTLAALAPITIALFCFLPAGLGALEGVFAGAVCLSLGEPTAIVGISLALIRRVRALAWIFLGLGLVGNPFKMFLK